MNVKTQKVFCDTNVLLYLLSDETAKILVVENILEEQQSQISVQVLNEILNVTLKKMRLEIDKIKEFLDLIKFVVEVNPITLATHELGLALIQKYNFSNYDAMIVASALLSDCDVLYSEDMQSNLVVNNQLVIINPFKS